MRGECRALRSAPASFSEFSRFRLSHVSAFQRRHDHLRLSFSLSLTARGTGALIGACRSPPERIRESDAAASASLSPLPSLLLDILVDVDMSRFLNVDLSIYSCFDAGGCTFRWLARPYQMQRCSSSSARDRELERRGGAKTK